MNDRRLTAILCRIPDRRKCPPTKTFFCAPSLASHKLFQSHISETPANMRRS